MVRIAILVLKSAWFWKAVPGRTKEEVEEEEEEEEEGSKAHGK